MARDHRNSAIEEALLPLRAYFDELNAPRYSPNQTVETAPFRCAEQMRLIGAGLGAVGAHLAYYAHSRERYSPVTGTIVTTLGALAGGRIGHGIGELIDDGVAWFLNRRFGNDLLP